MRPSRSNATPKQHTLCRNAQSHNRARVRHTIEAAGSRNSCFRRTEQAHVNSCQSVTRAFARPVTDGSESLRPSPLSNAAGAKSRDVTRDRAGTVALSAPRVAGPVCALSINLRETSGPTHLRRFRLPCRSTGPTGSPSRPNKLLRSKSSSRCRSDRRRQRAGEAVARVGPVSGVRVTPRTDR